MAKAMPPEVWCLVLVVVTKLACVDLIQVNVDVEILQHPHHRTKLSGLNLHISQSLKKKKSNLPVLHDDNPLYVPLNTEQRFDSLASSIVECKQLLINIKSLTLALLMEIVL